MRRLILLAVPIAGLAALAALAVHSTAGTKKVAPTRQEHAQFLLEHRARFMSSAGVRMLEQMAGRQPGEPDAPSGGKPNGAAVAAATTVAPSPPASAGVPNVRVNNPATDTALLDQTTQSETALAVSGSKVAVGYNDSSRWLLSGSAGSTFTGYSYSTDGGQTFTDGGALPNASGIMGGGDPWLAADRQGKMYFSQLAFVADVFNNDVTVSRSSDGGRTWSDPVDVTNSVQTQVYFADKDAVAAGRDPANAARDDVYVAWDDFNCDLQFITCLNELSVSRSTDGGQTWSVSVPDQFVQDPNTPCAFTQWIGAQPLVDPADGTVYLAAEKFSVNDTTPDCTGDQTAYSSEVIYRSDDGGQTFGPPVTIASVTPAGSFFGTVRFDRGQYMRVLEFPTLAVRNGTVYAAWDDGANGTSNIRFASSRDRGATWSLGWATNGPGDDVQPTLTADSAGLYLAYYHHGTQPTLDVYVADSTSGGEHWRTRRLTTQPFPSVPTNPNLDPVVAQDYMGDYIASATDGTHRYYAWGDNRDRIVNVEWPNGRNDPDVFFAKR
jgi:hypothetical protein